MSSPSPSPASLVAASDIADLAGVSRAAVSNWRRRHADFPKQVAGTKSKPLYALPEVQAWLTKKHYAVERVSIEAKVWAAMNTLRGQYSPEQSAMIVLAVAAERVMGDDAPASLELSRLTAPQGDDQHRIKQVREVVESVDESALASVVDYVLERTAHAEGRRGSWSDIISSRTSHLLASVAANHPGGVVYDPACGIASALIALRDTSNFDSYIGHDINDQALAIAEARAALHRVPLHLAEGDILRTDPDPGLRADVVIAEPPFAMRMDLDSRLTDPRFFNFGAPPASNADTAWIQHAITHLADTGRAFIITPHGPLFRGGVEGQIRAEILRQGCVETIVGLPGGMAAYTSIPLALWVLRRPNNEHSDVLFIDASDVDDAEKRVARWLSDGSALAEVPHVRVPVEDIVDDEAQLTPQRWLATNERSADDVQAAYATATTAMRDATQALTNASGRITFAQDAPSRPLTVKELIREGVIERSRGRAMRNPSDELKATIVGARAITSGELPDRANPDLVKNVENLSKPSDVLVLTQTDIGALVDEDGGHYLSPVVDRIRVLKPDVVDPHYLAAMLSGSWNRRFLVGTTIQRAKLTDLEIPLVPMDDQKRLIAALAEVERLRDAAETITAASENLSSSLLDAVRFNIELDTTAT
ncbi:N-6 DNA methylase [Rhodococcoides kyotonense]|uniref:Type I restriction endonuclease n=1 Tax=Rhodococcoides kyotonense TaxID=398843 RepID=A0A177YBU5_9NOCA|nr:N-6 DNA methylase [Rhodococcus kyotonensis]OAK53006.1 type I restriction endonuclease [Rhodococcus kyotonensis]